MVKPIYLLLLFLLAFASADVAKVAWNPNPEEELVTTYRIWRGTELIAEVTSPLADINLPTDTRSTITVTAVNITAESEHSEPFTLIPVVPQSTTDLVTWTDHPAFFVPDGPKRFFRFRYPTP